MPTVHDRLTAASTDNMHTTVVLGCQTNISYSLHTPLN